MSGEGMNSATGGESGGESNGKSSDVQVQWPVDLSHMRPEDAAEWVVKRYGDGAMPIRPEKIAKRLGIAIYALMPQDRHSVYRDANGKISIVIDPATSVHHRRFAIAHGLGHIFMRHDAPELEDTESFGRSPRDCRDQAANQFAASLLVPTEKLRWCLTSGWMRNVDQVLKTLWVPKDLLMLRYRQLIARR